MSTKERPKRSEVQTPGQVATQKQRAVSHSAARPVIEGRKPPTNIYKPRKKGVPKGNPASSVLAAAPGLAANRAQGAPSIAEMARALKNDVDEIFKFVHDNIEFIPTYGSQKGALGTLIDGFGNAFDQAELMIELLREAGYDADFQFGELELTAAQAADWLGNDEGSIWAASNLLSGCGTPNSTNWTGSQWVLRLSHVWVKVDIDSTDYVFDPAMKAYNVKAAIDLADAIGYDGGNFMDDATSGATVTSDYVKDLNRTNVRDNLATMAGNLVTYLKENAPSATLNDVIGGRDIVPVETPVRQTSLPYMRSGTTPTTWTDIPDPYKATLSVLYDTIDVSFYSRDIHGKRLTLFFNSSLEAELRLDGELVGTSDPQTPWSWNSVLLTITHPYTTTYCDQSFWQTVWAGQHYLIAQAWGNAGRAMIEFHRRKLSQSLFDGGAYDDEDVLGEALSVRWHTWNTQKSWSADVYNRMTTCMTALQHQVGLVGYSNTPVMDLGGIMWSTGALDNNWDNVNTNDTVLAMHGIAIEAGTIEQCCNINGISTTSILDKAVQAGMKIYDAHSSNWTGSVRPNLTNYSSQTLDDIENWYINWDWRIVLPEDGQITIDDFIGFGYYGVSPWWGAIGIFSGYLQGGMGSVEQPLDDMIPDNDANGTDPDSPTLPTCSDNLSYEPIDMARGTYLYRNTDLTVGSGKYPYALPFERFYTSGARLANGPLGLGWSHNWNHSVAQNSDGLLAMGSESPVSGATGLVAMFVTVDLYRDLAKPLDKWVTVAVTNRWLLDQSRNNTAFVSLPGDTQVFVKQPDGSYIAPNGVASTLTKNGGGDWTYVNKHKVESSYNADGQLTEIAFPFGVTISLTYSSGKLASVSNGLTRELNLTYDGDLLIKVEDETERFIEFGYDVDGNLETFTDAEEFDTTYAYDIPGRMTQVFKPANPLVAIVNNVYDSLGRVKQQSDGSSNVWTYYFAGSRSEEKNPEGDSRVQYLDGHGNLISETDAAGKTTKREYDGLNRLTKITFPEGNQRVFSYDVESNILTITDKAKSGSGLTDIVQTFTYDPDFNEVATHEDGRGNTITNTYDPTTGQLLQIELPEVDSEVPTVVFTYNGRGQVLTRTDPTGIVTLNAYDATTEKLDSVTVDQGTGRLNLLTQYGYNGVGDIIERTDPRGNATTFEWDDQRQLTKITLPTPFEYETKITYDGNGNRIKIERFAGLDGEDEPIWQTVNTTFTVDGLVETETDPAGHETNFTYNTLRKLWKKADALDRVIEYLYDECARLKVVKDFTGATAETRTYSNNGLLTTIKDANDNVTAFEYDGFDRLKKRTFEDDTTEQFTRDKNGNVLTKITRAGATIAFEWDALNRMIEKAPDGMPTVTFGYDLANRLLSISTPVVSGNPASGQFEFAYDTAGRLIREECPDGKQVGYQLDANGNVQRLTYPDSYYVDRVYDQLNRLTGIKLNGATTPYLDFGYDPLSRRTSLNYGNGQECLYTYEIDDMVKTVVQLNEDVTFEYGYNAAHEVVSQEVDDAAYMRHPGSAGTVSYATANDLNQYPSVASVSYSYNNNGCLTGDGTWTFGYDPENRLTSASKTGVSAAYLYDPFNRQTQKEVNSTKTRYVYSGFQRVADYNGSNVLVGRFVYGTTLDEPLMSLDGSGNITCLHHDRLGSIIATTDDTGDLINSYAYLPWGEGGALTGTTFGYTGQRYDAETGLYYFKNRHYSPALGRFLQPDPVLYADSLNAYEYARSNPLSLTDPYGLSADSQTPGDIGNWTPGEPGSSGGCSCDCGGESTPPITPPAGGTPTNPLGGGGGGGDTPIPTVPIGAFGNYFKCVLDCIIEHPAGPARFTCTAGCAGQL